MTVRIERSQIFLPRFDTQLQRSEVDYEWKETPMYSSYQDCLRTSLVFTGSCHLKQVKKLSNTFDTISGPTATYTTAFNNVEIPCSNNCSDNFPAQSSFAQLLFLCRIEFQNQNIEISEILKCRLRFFFFNFQLFEII